MNKQEIIHHLLSVNENNDAEETRNEIEDDSFVAWDILTKGGSMIEKLWENIVINVGDRARAIKCTGFIIVMLPTLWDILRLGTKGFFEWRVYPLGICISIVGAIIMLTAECIRQWFD